MPSYNHASTLESVALKETMVLLALMLQKPHSRSKGKQHITSSEDRLGLRLGGIDTLLHEGCTIQHLHGNQRSNHNDGRMARSC